MAKDYAAYAKSIRPDAEGGSIEAQYFLSAALRYCKENLGIFFLIPGKPSRTLVEAQYRWAKRPLGLRQEIDDTYARCHAFLEDPAAASQMAEADDWLDKASAGAYPLAQMKKAILQFQATMVASASQKANLPSRDQVQGLALQALESSSDPEIIWTMTDLANELDTPAENRGIVSSAWQLLACQRGYDCSADAEWLRNVCNYDPGCYTGETGEDYLERHLGAHLDQAQRVATAIGTAIDAKDWDLLTSYLSNSNELWTDINQSP